MKKIEIIIDKNIVQIDKENPVMLITFDYGSEEDLYCTLLGHVSQGLADLKKHEKGVFDK